MFATRTHSPITPARDAAVRATFTPFGLMDKENVPPAWLAVRSGDDDDDGEKARVIAVPVGRDGECGETRQKSRTPSRPVLLDITRRFTPLEVRASARSQRTIFGGKSGFQILNDSGRRLTSRTLHVE